MTLSTVPVVEFDRVTKVYAGKSPVTALNEVSLVVEPNALLAVVGTSGSGKSTMMNLMGALDVPSEGTVRINGANITELSDNEVSSLRSSAIGFVFQSFNLLGSLSAAENVSMGAMYQGLARHERHERALALLDRVGLADRAHHRAVDLSGGERQRVAIARALLGDPPIVLADEPTGNLDSGSSREVMQILFDVHAEGKTLILITHDQGLADQFNNQIRLSDGRVVQNLARVT